MNVPAVVRGALLLAAVPLYPARASARAIATCLAAWGQRISKRTVERDLAHLRQAPVALVLRHGENPRRGYEWSRRPLESAHDEDVFEPLRRVTSWSPS